MSVRPMLFVVISFVFVSQAWARTWTNTEGKEIVAEFVSADETHVTLQMGDRELEYAIEKLSVADREWIASQEEEEMEPVAAVAVPTGMINGLPISERLFPDSKEFFKEKARKSVLQAFENGAFENISKSDPVEWFARDLEKDLCNIYVPASYDGSKPYGLYLNIRPQDKGQIQEGWKAIFDELNVIAVTPMGTGNNRPMLRRVMLSMDALATVQKQYKIDPKRRVAGGLSGGGHMAMLTGAMFPEVFLGAVSHAAQSYLPGGGGGGHFPGMTVRDFKRDERKAMKWVVISGNKDRNYKAIIETGKLWEDEGLSYRFIDVDGMGHTDAAGKDLLEALMWIGL